MLKLLQDDWLQPLLFRLLIITARVYEFLSQAYWIHPARLKHLQEKFSLLTLLIANGEREEDGSCSLKLLLPHSYPFISCKRR